MQTATIMVALNGDKNHSFEKYDVTPSEVAVLRIIHGDDAVSEINPQGDVKRSNKEERERLSQLYGRSDEHGRFHAPAVDALFPGAAARLFETFEELDLPEDLYKAETRVTSASPVAQPVAKPEKAKKATKAKAEPEPTEAPAETEADDEDDGIGEMPDNMFR